MTKLLLALVVSLATACAARPSKPMTPADSAAALTKFASGVSLAQIATELGLDSADDARTVVHDAMLDTHRRFYQDR